ncbi:MAG: NAD(+)/NADH kinase [Clostridia bacterium]|nr:NAD(+)/NADH kinase [Clostridia bacterium]
MRKIVIITNQNKDADAAITKKCSEVLSDYYEITYDNGISFDNTLHALKNASAAIVIGGDGTILSASIAAATENVPLLGINLGNLGYLADVELSEIETAMHNFLNGKYTIEERFMIEAHCMDNNGNEIVLPALNDIVISRASYTRMIALDVLVDGNFLSSYVGDGIVISTPTGSTAYSLSAGGPVAHSSLEVSIITPICSHTMGSKPIIIPGSSTITVKFHGTFDDKSMLTADGQRAVKIVDGDKITVTASKLKTKLIKVSNRSFCEILHKKLQG